MKLTTILMVGLLWLHNGLTAQIVPDNLGRIVQVAGQSGVLPQTRLLIGIDSNGFGISTSAEGTFKLFGNLPYQTHLNNNTQAINRLDRFGAPGGNDSYEIRYGDSSRYWITTSIYGTEGTLAPDLVPFSIYNVGPRSGESLQTSDGTRICISVRDENGDGIYTAGERVFGYGDMVLPLDSTYSDLSSQTNNPFTLSSPMYFAFLRTAQAAIPNDATQFNPVTDGFAPPAGTVLRLVAATSDTALPVIVIREGVTFGRNKYYYVDDYSYTLASLAIVSGPSGLVLNGTGDLEWDAHGYIGTEQLAILSATNPAGTTYPHLRLSARLQYAVTDTNEIWMWQSQNGSIAFDEPQVNYGMTFKDTPNGSLIFASGPFVAGRNSADELLLSRAEYEGEFRAGRLLNGGVDPFDLVAENPDTATASLFVLPYDGAHWPADAPRNSQGDPLLISLNDTWSVFNDRDTSVQSHYVGNVVKPMGVQIERQTYQFGSYPLDKAVIVRMRLINKSDESYSSTYLSIWADPDIGQESSFDLSAADSALGLVYSYNAEGDDALFWASGVQILQGLAVDSSSYTDTLLMVGPDGFVRRAAPGKYDLKATSAFGGSNLGIQQYESMRYNIMRGLTEGGDPKPYGPWDVWIGAVPGDQRVFINSGPVTLAAGDTQDVFYAYLGARGLSNDEAKANLLAQASVIKQIFDNGLIVDVAPTIAVPDRFHLYPNFPNPFNPSTTIRFSLERAAHVKLEVYNVLGQKVRTLANGRFAQGVHAETWDGRNESGYPAASGVYIYRLEAEGLVSARKMILIK